MLRRTSQKVVFLLVASFLLIPFAVAEQDKSESPQLAPEFILPTWDGKVLKSRNLKGQVIVLEFFQSGCPDCQQASPELEKLYRRYKGQGLTVIGISHDREGTKAVEPFVKKYGISYPVLMGDLSIAINYIGVTPQKTSFRIPYIVLIDRQGKIVGKFEEGTHKEATDIKLLEAQVKKLL